MPESQVGPSVTWSGLNFTIGPANTKDVVQATGQTITVPEGEYTSVKLLALGVNGNQPNQTFTIHYADGSSTTVTQSISDWHMPQHYAGESIALSSSYRNNSWGAKDYQGPFDVYGYTLPVNSSKLVTSITLPNNKNVVVLAITVVAP